MAGGLGHRTGRQHPPIPGSGGWNRVDFQSTLLTSTTSLNLCQTYPSGYPFETTP
jgi:hypothetical protein